MHYQVFGCVPARTRQFVPFVQGTRSRFTYDENFFCYVKVASLCYIGIGPGASHYFPGHSKFRFGVLQGPGVFTQLGCVPFVLISEWNRVISESCFELVRSKTHVCFLSHGAFMGIVLYILVLNYVIYVSIKLLKSKLKSSSTVECSIAELEQ